MNPICCNKSKPVIAGSFWLHLAVLLLLLPLRWLVAAGIAAAVHELCHMAAIRLVGAKILGVRIRPFGTEIRTSPLNPIQELLCALSGPVGGLCLILFAKWVPAVSLCAAFQSLYNLLPIYPADGGRILRCGVRLVLPEEKARAVISAVELVSVSGIGLMSLYGAFTLRLGLMPLLIGSVLICKAVCKK